jgi:sporulation protein YlmC with PRC-barrel domain
MRNDLLLSMKLEGREVVNEYGTYMGKIVGVSGQESSLVLQSMFEKRFTIPFRMVSVVTDANVVVRMSG